MTELGSAAKAISDLEEQRKKLIGDKTYEDVAVFLHNKKCYLDHTDRCRWFYEFKNGEEDWDGSTHERYLELSEKLVNEIFNEVDLNVISFDEILKIVELFERA